MCQTIGYDHRLTAEEIAEHHFSGCEIISDQSGREIGYRYYRWW